MTRYTPSATMAAGTSDHTILMRKRTTVIPTITRARNPASEMRSMESPVTVCVLPLYGPFNRNGFSFRVPTRGCVPHESPGFILLRRRMRIFKLNAQSMANMEAPSLKERVYDVLEPGYDQASVGAFFQRFFDVFITLVILVSIAIMVLSSVKTLDAQFGMAFDIIFFFTTIVFSIEYPLRVWSCTADPRYASPVRGRLAWMLTPFALIDLIVVLPFYLELFIGINLTGLVVLRVFRIFKLIRYSDSINMIIRVVKAQRDMLITAYLVLFIALISASTLMFQIERPGQPEVFTSIPATMWWGIVTLTTVGYGDMVPMTAAGKVLGGCITLLGIGIFALPAGILASGFTQELQRRMPVKNRTPGDAEEEVFLCPHCKTEIRGRDLWKKR
ncbi:MAG: Voltage-gated potassium channel [Methanoregulaceae archaeon PtaU1.Bin059]|nr:MAG: Voltage-gated potassium channel [Methanoregulaceae archaeon PtaU1.Bin059]